MESRTTRVRRSLWLAVGLSLLLHAALLFVDYSATDQPPGLVGTTSAAPPRLLATLARPPTPDQPRPTLRRAAAPPRASRKLPATPASSGEKRKITAPDGVWTKRSWSAAERAEMNNFLDELAVGAKPTDARQLSEKALAQARQLGSREHGDGQDPATRPVTRGNGIDPYSLEMYFDAFVRKMNRSAAFVNNVPDRRRGSRKALVEITLNDDGSLKSYRVLRSADQAIEIAYIKSVIERASPFSAFPRDIRRATDPLTIQMCILPAHAGGEAGFSRSLGAHDCRD